MRVKDTYKIILISIALLCFTVNSRAQYSSEEELKEAANKMFEEQNYAGSLELFSQLLSTYPKDPNYNYKYGACVLFGAREKDDALRFLKFAVTKPSVDPIAFYFLGKGYHHEYEFAKAIENYNKFKEKASSKEQKKYSVDREIEMCQNGEKLMRSMADIGVLSKKEIKESDFFRSYKLNGIGGKIIVKPEDFQTKLDKKNKERSVVYLGQAKDVIIYSSYGKDGSNGKDIYKSVKKSNGDWSEGVPFSNKVNSPYDEDYPFLHPDGKTLYFSSKGFSSMGGYDVFKSTFNEVTKEWSAPKNLDFPINTPDDDILYISDMENKLAYFASSRASKQGELTVYNVAVESVPFVHSVIYGFFVAEANPEMKNATITVRAVDKDRKYGVHVTKSETGEYLLMFPTNGGKFKILVETTEDAPVHSAIIEIPKLESFRALKQELRLVGEGDNEKLIIKNLFDESDEFDINNPLVVQNILKERAKMEVNVTEAELDSIAETRKEEEIIAGDNLSNSLGSALADALNKSVYKEYSDEDLAVKTDETADRIISQTEISKAKAITSYKIAEEKSAEAKILYAASEELLIEAESIESETGKNEKIALAERKKLDAAKLINEVVAALAIGKTLDNEVVERGSDLEKVKLLQSSINANLNNKERELAETDLKKLDEIASATYHNESALDTEAKIVDDKLLVEEKKYSNLNEYVVDLQDREIELATSIKTLEEKKALTKKKKEIEVIDEQIKSLTIDVEDTQFDLGNAKKKAAKGKSPYLKAKNEAAITKAVIAMLDGENNNEEEITDPEKIQLENDIAYFEKEGLVGLYSEEEVLPVLVASENDNPVITESITSEEPIVTEPITTTEESVTYKARHEAALANFSGEDTYESSTLKAAVHENWAKDIEEEIEEKKADLSITSGSEKKGVENEIAILENNLMEQEEFASLYALQAESMKDETPAVTEPIATEDPVITEPITSEEPIVTEPITTTEEPVTYKAKHEAALADFSGEDTYESSTLKAAVHEDWAKDIEEEIASKQADLEITSGSEKKGVENEIAILENNLLEQEEFASLYALQAESMKDETPAVTEPIATEEPVTYKAKHEAALADFSGEDTYESSTLKAAVHENWAKDIEEEIASKQADLEITSGSEKKGVENEIAILENNLLEQEEFASLYALQAESMKDETPAVTEPIATEEPVTYKAKHEAALADFSGEDTYESSTLKAAVHENWVKDIEEEIASKQADLEITSGSEKKGVENEIAILENNLLEQEEFASLYALQAESMKDETPAVTEPITTEEPVITEPITSEEPIVTEPITTTEEPVTYKAKHEAALADFSGEDTYESSTLKAAVHENWAKDIEEEIEEKKADLSITSGSEKKGVENEIAILENNLLEQEEFASLYALQAESMKDDVVAVTEPIVTEEPVVTEPITSEEPIVTEPVTTTEEPVTYKAKHETALADFSGEDTYESSTLKAAVHENWAKDIEQEIAEKKADLSITSGSEKKGVENEIAILENNLLEQEEFASLYALQAESMKDETPAVTEPIATEEPVITEPITSEEPIVTEPITTTEEPVNNKKPTVTTNELSEENLTENNLNGAEDDFSNLKYNNKFNYKSTQSKTALTTVTALKSAARTLKEEADVKLNEASTTSDETEKSRLTKEAEVLYEKSQRKQEGIAKVYEGANRSEYYDNQKTVTELSKNNTINPINITIAELMMDEANNYYEESKLNRDQAVSAPDFSARERLLQKAYELEMKAIEAQKKAINKLSEGSTTPALASSNSNNTTEEPVVTEEPIVNNEQPTSNNNVLKDEVEELTATDKNVVLAMKSTEITAVKEEAEYQEYAELKNKKRRLIKEAEVEYVKVAAFEADIVDQKALVVSLNSVDEASQTEQQKTVRKYQITEIEKIIAENEAQILALRKSAQAKETQVKEVNSQTDAILINANETDAKNYTAIERAETYDGAFMAKVMRKTVKPSVISEPTVSTSQPTLANIDAIPTVLKESIFVISKNKSVYSNSKKIPVSPRLPEGLVFKVQIGAFRNPIPQSHFKGFAPIMAEDAGRGITRYTAGLFKSFNSANEAKGIIRSIGYSDAFVVAFLNGKRINMTKAREMLNGGTVDAGSLANNTTSENTTGTSNSGTSNNGVSNNNTSNNGNVTTTPSTGTKEVKDGISKDVRNIGGVFFTIQIGVYSKQVTKGQLNNVSPLNSERTASGLIRYTSGVFKTLDEANSAKARIRSNGIPDAFVVAYNNGAKTTVANAKEQLGLNIPVVPKKDEIIEKPIEDELAKALIEKEEVTPEEKEEPIIEVEAVKEEEVLENVIEEEAKEEVTPVNNEIATALKIKFKVQLGAYTDGVPVEEAGLFLKLTSRGIKNYEQDGKTIYIIGSFRDYASATDLQIEMKEMGVKNPKVVAFQRNETIEVNKALELIENN